MKKSVLILMSFVLLVISGCSANDKKELIVWNAGIVEEDPNNKVSKEDMPIQKAIAEFEEKYPEYKVTLVGYDAETFNQAFTAANAAGEGPDVVMTWAGTATTDYSKYLLDLNTVSDDFDIEKFDTSAITHEDFDPNKALLALPNGNTATGLFYNKKILEENKIDPQSIVTWDDYLGVAEKLKSNNVTSMCVGDVDGYTTTWATGEFYIDQVGPEGLAKLYSGENKMDSKEMTKSIEAWKMQFDKGYTNPDWASTNDGDALKRFANDECAFMTQGSWALHGFNEMGENYNVIKFPSLSEDDEFGDYVMSQPMTNAAVTSYSKNQDVAVQFITMVSTPEFIKANDEILYDNDYTTSISTDMNSWASSSAMGFDSAINSEAASEFYKLAPTAVRGDISIEEFLASVQKINKK